MLHIDSFGKFTVIHAPLLDSKTHELLSHGKQFWCEENPRVIDSSWIDLLYGLLRVLC